MPVVSCPFCSNPVTLPDPWAGVAYTCPHCRRVVTMSPPPRPTPRPAPPPPPPPLEMPDDDFEPEPEPRPSRTRRKRGASGGMLGDFFTFRLMITPLIIQILFWIGVLVCLAAGVRIMAASFDSQPEPVRSAWEARDSDRFATDTDKKAKSSSSRQFSALQFATGLAVVLIGPLMLRLYCELGILFFKIHDELKTANDRQRYRN